MVAIGEFAFACCCVLSMSELLGFLEAELGADQPTPSWHGGSDSDVSASPLLSRPASYYFPRPKHGFAGLDNQLHTHTHTHTLTHEHEHQTPTVW